MGQMGPVGAPGRPVRSRLTCSPCNCTTSSEMQASRVPDACACQDHPGHPLSMLPPSRLESEDSMPARSDFGLVLVWSPSSQAEALPAPQRTSRWRPVIPSVQRVHKEEMGSAGPGLRAGRPQLAWPQSRGTTAGLASEQGYHSWPGLRAGRPQLAWPQSREATAGLALEQGGHSWPGLRAGVGCHSWPGLRAGSLHLGTAIMTGEILDIR